MTDRAAIACRLCRHPNEAGARFCEACGATLLSECPACGHAVGEHAHFCTACGERLGTPSRAIDQTASDRPAPSASAREARPATGLSSEPAAALRALVHPAAPLGGAAAPAPAHEPAQGERRQLTVLFSDLVGSTELSEKLDPEDWAEIAARYQRTTADAVASLRGHVAKYLGDGVLAYFGYPKAHDNDAERAVRAGLAIVEAVAGVNREMARERGVQLAVRIGIHTGWVAIEEGGGTEREIFGETPNLAARVQTAAEPDTVLVTEATHRLVSGFFLVEDRGPVELKGIAAPVRLYRIVGATGARARIDVAVLGGLTPFVGRDDELHHLQRRWEQARAGNGQLVLITGEVGIGKSRLVHAARQRIASGPHIWIELQCVPFQKRTPFFPIADMLQRSLSSRVDGSPEATAPLSTLERAVELAGLDPARALPLLAPLLGSAAADRYPPLVLSPEDRRRRLLAMLVDWVRGMAALQPLVLVIEDVQWADPSTLELLGVAAEQVATAPLLVLCTARSEFRPTWPAHVNHTRIALDRLDRAEAIALVHGVAGGDALEAGVVGALVARTDGVPLFLEELTKLVVENDAGAGRALEELEIPSTIQGSLTARLDRLRGAREVAQVASVIGREFSYQLLRAISSLGDDELQAALARLAGAELLYVRGLPPDATYAFKHPLVQEAAYASLLKSRRREIHAVIARALDEILPPGSAGRPELLAHHWTEAGDRDAAIAAWECAGDQALRSSAHAEAVLHLEAGIALIPALPDGPERARREFALQLRLGEAVAFKRGYGAPEVERVYARARELCDQVGDDLQRGMLFLGLWTSAANRGELRAAQVLADELLAVTGRQGFPAAQVWGNFVQGTSRFFLGEMPSANEHLDRAIELYCEDDHLEALVDPSVAALAISSAVTWHLGLVERARRRATESVELAERLRRPYGGAFARDYAAMVYVALEEPETVFVLADALVRLASDLHLPLFAAHGVMQRGWALARLGKVEEGIAELRRGRELLAETGERLGLGFLLSLLAEVLAQQGVHDEARAVIDDALGAVEEERHDKPEILRRRGDILAAIDPAAAEASYREAIARARACSSVSAELRAAVALGRRLANARRDEEARALLEPLLADPRMAEGIADLGAARALLEAMGREGRGRIAC